MKKCSTCKIKKELVFFSKNKYCKDGLQTRCKKCVKIYNDEHKLIKKKNDRKYYIENKEKILERNRKWVNENRTVSNNIKTRYYNKNKKEIHKKMKLRVQNNDFLNLKARLRARTNCIFKKHGYCKNSKTEKLLGLSYKEIKKYLELQFTNNMNWDNRDKWHIDHIIPLSSANNKEELIKLCHYTNLQPLWAIDNLKKGKKYETR